MKKVSFLIFILILLSSCSYLEPVEDFLYIDNSTDKMILIEKTQKNVSDFVAEYASISSNMKKNRIKNISTKELPHNNVETNKISGEIDFEIDEDYVNPYQFIDINQVYGLADVFAELEIIKHIDGEKGKFNGKLYSFYEGNHLISGNDVTVFNDDKIIFVKGVLYSLSFENFFYLHVSNLGIEYIDNNHKITCYTELDLKDKNIFNKLCNKADKLGIENFNKKNIKAAWDAQQNRDEKILNNEQVKINLLDYDWYNSYFNPVNLASQFYQIKYYYHAQEKHSYNGSYSFKNENNEFGSSYGVYNFDIEGFNTCYVPEKTKHLLIEVGKFYRIDCIYIPSSVEEISQKHYQCQTYYCL